MCQTCDQAAQLPTAEALKLVAGAMKRRPRDCLDRLVGRLIGVELDEPDRETEANWELRRPR